MRLVVDASTLVAELLRVRGRQLFANPALDLFVAADAWDEAEYELRRRVALLVERGHLASSLATELLDAALGVITEGITSVAAEAYADRAEEARRRIPV